MKAIQVSLISGFSIAVLFALLCSIFHSSDFRHIFVAASAGMFIGFVSAPEISPKSFKKPALFQIISGMLTGLFIALFFKWGGQGTVISILVFGFLGYTVKHWGHHVPVP